MYQPYIRGKQFELIGIRELTTSVLSPNKEKVSNEVFNPLSCKTLVISRFFFVKIVSVSSFVLRPQQFRQHVFVVFQVFLQELSIAASFS